MSKAILIIGGTSAIAEAVARRYAAQGARLFLVARDENKLNIVATDLLARGAEDVQFFVMDMNDNERLPTMLDAAWQVLENVDIALIAHGTLPDQHRCEVDVAYAIAEFRTNAESIIACLITLAARFETQGNGVIAAISSVASDRGRQPNYLYGSAKAAVTTCCEGLRVRLFKSGVHVLTIKPGFVDTPMTRELSLPDALVVSTDTVAKDIVKAISVKRDVLYTPWFWRVIMVIIRSIPNAIFNRLKL